MLESLVVDRNVRFKLKDGQPSLLWYINDDNEVISAVILAEKYTSEELDDLIKNHESIPVNLLYTQEQDSVPPAHVINAGNVYNVISDVIRTHVAGYNSGMPITVDVLIDRDKHNTLLELYRGNE